MASDNDLPPGEATSPEPAGKRGLERHVPEGIRIFPNAWPGATLPVEPGDLTRFAPQGFCFGGPVIMRPWDTVEEAIITSNYYGARPAGFHPLYNAPLTESSGGTLYFNAGAESEKVLGALDVMHAPMGLDKYAVFVTEAVGPRTEGFLVHCRIIPYDTLDSLFRAPIETIEGGSTPQPMTVRDFVRGFIRLHEERYGTGMSAELYGIMGGDGDWAREALCFGFMVENPYHGICRLWTRAWLVTK